MSALEVHTLITGSEENGSHIHTRRDKWKNLRCSGAFDCSTQSTSAFLDLAAAEWTLWLFFWVKTELSVSCRHGGEVRSEEWKCEHAKRVIQSKVRLSPEPKVTSSHNNTEPKILVSQLQYTKQVELRSCNHSMFGKLAWFNDSSVIICDWFIFSQLTS